MTNDISLIPITDIKGISAVREKLFGSVGIKTVGDLLSYYPELIRTEAMLRMVISSSGSTLTVW